MKRLLHALVFLVALQAGQADAAMYLDPHGQGQVLLYPYYSVNAGQSSLVSLVNTTARGKMLHVSFRKGVSGEETLDFYVYLAPRDTWTATVFATDAQSVANLLTDDGSCSNPDLHDGALPKLPDGRSYVPWQPCHRQCGGRNLLGHAGHGDRLVQ